MQAMEDDQGRFRPVTTKISEWLNQRLHDSMAPADDMSAAVCVSFLAITAMRESAPSRSGQAH